ncbi:hypothetical protein ALP8811_02651 [Aliiroseovarius pelagivivens]|uniref:Uncharacterized protein n=1 Tax=Aliiroseovarius pelagivivens TaxID=1639690 RepID=A0A2R8ARX5_9RHOB|nr:hypothetical protein [Aliiroseovarius pelagivivens]SPF78720.1 hypothetical protein ALP8811_02651 [Aliiroseovarius pelagivivens]
MAHSKEQGSMTDVTIAFRNGCIFDGTQLSELIHIPHDLDRIAFLDNSPPLLPISRLI